MSEIQSYLLAGGNGKRAGGPKALQPYEDELDLQLGMNFFIIEKPFVAAEVTDLARRILM